MSIDAPSVAGLRLLAQAKRHAGVTEQPPFSNRGPEIDKWNKAAGVPVGSYWCMAFIYSCALAAGVEILQTASVGYFLAWARREGLVVRRPRKGDIVCFYFDEKTPGWPSHVGVVEKVTGLRWLGKRFTGFITTWEGNTSSDDFGSQSNGGGVFQRRRKCAKVRVEFVRVR